MRSCSTIRTRPALRGLAFLCMLGIALMPAIADDALTLREYAEAHGPLKVYTVPLRFSADGIPVNAIDQRNNLKEGERILPLSGLGLTDIAGISELLVDDGGRVVPIASVPELHLFLNDNEIAIFPKDLTSLRNVIYLYLKENRLETIPPEIAQMTGLRGVYFTGNRISAIPRELFEMTWLRKLELTDNRIGELSPEIGALEHLIHFRIDRNQLEFLPDSIDRLVNLRVVDFSHNRLTRIPDSFGNVRILYVLRLNGNEGLLSLPDGDGFAGMSASIEIDDTAIERSRLPPRIRARVEATRPQGNYQRAMAERLAGSEASVDNER